MKYFLDSAKLDEIKLAYNTFGIDGVTTNPRHIMLSGKPFLTAITDIANWIKEEGLEGYEKFPVSVEINPHLDDTEEMIAAAKKVSAISENFVIKIPCTEAGVAAARRLEKEGIRTNVTLVFSPAQAIWPAKNGSLFVSPFLGWKEANGEDCKQYIKDIVDWLCAGVSDRFPAGAVLRGRAQARPLHRGSGFGLCHLPAVQERL